MIRDVSGPMQGSVRLVQGEGLLSHGVRVCEGMVLLCVSRVENGVS